MNRHKRVRWVGLAVFTLVAFSVPRQLAAQTADSALIATVNRLDPGRRLRIEAAGRPDTEGVFLALDGGDLLLGAPADPTRVPLAEIERLWTRQRATKTVAIVGGIAGLALGAAAGLVIGEVICNNEDCNANTAAAMALTGSIGGVGGLAVGAAADSFIPVWKLRFP